MIPPLTCYEDPYCHNSGLFTSGNITLHKTITTDNASISNLDCTTLSIPDGEFECKDITTKTLSSSNIESVRLSTSNLTDKADIDTHIFSTAGDLTIKTIGIDRIYSLGSTKCVTDNLNGKKILMSNVESINADCTYLYNNGSTLLSNVVSNNTICSKVECDTNVTSDTCSIRTLHTYNFDASNITCVDSQFNEFHCDTFTNLNLLTISSNSVLNCPFVITNLYTTLCHSPVTKTNTFECASIKPYPRASYIAKLSTTQLNSDSLNIDNLKSKNVFSPLIKCTKSLKIGNKIYKRADIDHYMSLKHRFIDNYGVIICSDDTQLDGSIRYITVSNKVKNVSKTVDLTIRSILVPYGLIVTMGNNIEIHGDKYNSIHNYADGIYHPDGVQLTVSSSF